MTKPCERLIGPKLVRCNALVGGGGNMHAIGACPPPANRNKRTLNGHARKQAWLGRKYGNGTANVGGVVAHTGVRSADKKKKKT
ncbi:MAG: hypothetical protein Q7S36_03595 [Candidatus Liptonbacteria bacterium]|nr:hypothetical protein [Candidatus Liptonbacteria bacterium]